MAQGAVKKSTRTAAPKIAHSKKQASRVGKPAAASSGSTSAKAKKASAAKAQKKFTSGMAARTEAMLGERAGHLELIGKGKKSNQKLTNRGGSKKFG